jgi:hypothetical protein
MKRTLRLPVKGLLAVLALFTVPAFAQQYNGYTLYSVQNSSAAALLDTTGAVFHSWTFSTSAKTGYSVYLRPGGNIIRTVARTGNSFSGGPICGQVQESDWNGNVTWDFIYSTTQYCTHHDICPMPNGNVLLISYERKTATEATLAGSATAIEIWPDKIVEVQPTGATTGTVVWEWHAWDHLCQNMDSTKNNYVSVISDHPELLNINYNTQKDWMHVNGVDYNAALNQIVISSHNLNEIYVIDHSTTTAEAASHTGGNSGMGGDILFRWGNPAAYSTPGTNVFHTVHDAHWVPQGYPRENYLVGYNNNGISTTQSCVDLISPPYNGYTYSKTPGTAYQPANYTLRYACNGHNSNMGNSQQLPNGNLLICIAQLRLIQEVDSNNTLLWSFTATGNVAKAYRYSPCYISGVQPAMPAISQQGDTLSSTPGIYYQWFTGGAAIAGATQQQFLPAQTGYYQVQVTDSNGCASDVSPDYYYSVTGIPWMAGSRNSTCIPIHRME